MPTNTAKQLFDGLIAAKDLVLTAAPGLKDFSADVSAEASRLGKQGAMELASALFSGSAFVPYGPGQYTTEPSHEQQPAELEAQQSHEGNGR